MFPRDNQNPVASTPADPAFRPLDNASRSPVKA